MNENIVKGIILIFIGCLALFKAIKYPGSRGAVNINRKEYMVGISAIIFGVMYILVCGSLPGHLCHCWCKPVACNH
ncbi:MAG: hypothetical protein V4620_07970 [Bacteroidota bacterium]